MQCPFKKVCCNCVVNSDSNSKHKITCFPVLPQNVDLGVAVLEKYAKIKTALALRNKAFFLFECIKAQKSQFQKANHCYMRIKQI